MKTKKITIIPASSDNIDDVFYYKRIIEDAELQKETISKRRTIDEFFSHIGVDSLIVYKDKKITFGIYDKFNKETYVFCMYQNCTSDDETDRIVTECVKEIVNNKLSEVVINYTDSSTMPSEYLYHNGKLYELPSVVRD